MTLILGAALTACSSVPSTSNLSSTEAISYEKYAVIIMLTFLGLSYKAMKVSSLILMKVPLLVILQMAIAILMLFSSLNVQQKYKYSLVATCLIKRLRDPLIFRDSNNSKCAGI